jgi:hypothetical protein
VTAVQPLVAKEGHELRSLSPNEPTRAKIQERVILESSLNPQITEQFGCVRVGGGCSVGDVACVTLSQKHRSDHSSAT